MNNCEQLIDGTSQHLPISLKGARHRWRIVREEGAVRDAQRGAV